jgi:hypothetical protein
MFSKKLVYVILLAVVAVAGSFASVGFTTAHSTVLNADGGAPPAPPIPLPAQLNVGA